MSAMAKTNIRHDFEARNIENAEAPPSYQEIYPSAVQRDQLRCSQALALSGQSYSSPRSDTFKPIVVPQTSKTFRGAFFSPFSRAYSPALAQSSISQSDFLSFIDGLNEAFIAAPGYQIVSYAGTIMSFIHVPIIPQIGLGVTTAAGLASATTSWTRARSYVKAANEEIFNPQGLKVKLLKTQKMMSAVGASGAVLNLPPLEMKSWCGQMSGGMDDPRMRRLRALGDTVAPLTFNGLPAPEELESWWKRWGSSEAQKTDTKQQKKLMKQRGKDMEKWEEKQAEADREGAKYDREVQKLYRKRQQEITKAEQKLAGQRGVDPGERAKVEHEMQKELRKLAKEVEREAREKDKRINEIFRGSNMGMGKADRKEQEIAQKIYWIVIDKIEATEGSEDDVESYDSKE